MRIDKISVKGKDGTYIPVIAYHLGEESVKGVIVVIHGFGEHSGSYKELAGNLGRANYASVVINQRGHGDIPEQTPEKRKKSLGVIPDYQSFLDDIGAVTAEIKQKAPNTPLVLYGHSMGGNIVVNYLLRHSQSDFSCAVLESPWLGLHKEVDRVTSFLTKALSYAVPNAPLPRKLTKLSLGDITGDEEKQKEIRNDPLYHNRMSLRLFEGINGGCTYAMNHASQLSVPTYLAFAGGEKIVSNRAIERFGSACGPNVTMKEYESNHAIHNDKNREAFYQDIIDFIDTHCPAVQPA